MNNIKSFYKGKRVLVTGHNGFKGTWMCQILKDAGANVIGYSLEPTTEPSLYDITNMSRDMTSVIGDIRDLDHLMNVFDQYQPEIVFHLAAQPIVRTSYEEPVYTYGTNVMGTVNICEAIRKHTCTRSFVNITTDKVYKNNEWKWGYRENDELGGYDPYSNSKSCSELVTKSYINAFFKEMPIAVSTCRAGNVIGGGDFAKDRIIPDCIRAQENHSEIIVRNPYSTRPYQHVLEPVCAYLQLAKLQYLDKTKYEGHYNIGPDDCDCVTTGELVKLFCDKWGDNASWKEISEKGAPHEAGFLKLDCSRIKQVVGWKPKWHIEEAVERVVSWSKVYFANGDVVAEMKSEIRNYLEE